MNRDFFVVWRKIRQSWPVAVSAQKCRDLTRQKSIRSEEGVGRGRRGMLGNNVQYNVVLFFSMNGLMVSRRRLRREAEEEEEGRRTARNSSIVCSSSSSSSSSRVR